MPPAPQAFRVKVEEGETGLVYATSADLRGFLAAANSLAELEIEIPKAITDLFRAQGREVAVRKARDADTWIAAPVAA